jgi:hypothetical protein
MAFEITNPLGTARTKNFQIGSAELRFGALSSAGRLKQSDSAGLIQSASVNFAQNSVDLKAGLPQQLVDSVITETTVTVTAQAYEFTRRNMRLMVNEGTVTGETEWSYISTAVADATDILSSQATTGAKTLKITATGISATNLAVNDLVGVYAASSPEKFSVIKLTAISVTGSVATLTFDAGATPMVYDLGSSDKVVAYKINPVSLGKSAETKYFTVDILGKNHASNQVQGFRFWKAAIQGGLDYSFSNDNFAVTPLTFKILLPTAEEVGVGGALNGIAGLYADHPLGMFWSGQAGLA